MGLKRIIASGITAFLLCISSLGLACELSCAFAQDLADCHSSLSDSKSSSLNHSDMQMDGMNMAMDANSMADMANDAAQSSTHAAEDAMRHFPLIGETMACERQSCDDRVLTSEGTTHSIPLHLHAVLFVTETPHNAGAPPLFQNRGVEAVFDLPRDASPPTLSLRV